MEALKEISERFRLADTVSLLQTMMKDVTSKDINAENVNAACNCVNALNSTIKTAISASRFLAAVKEDNDSYE